MHHFLFLSFIGVPLPPPCTHTLRSSPTDRVQHRVIAIHTPAHARARTHTSRAGRGTQARCSPTCTHTDGRRRVRGPVFCDRLAKISRVRQALRRLAFGAGRYLVEIPRLPGQARRALLRSGAATANPTQLLTFTLSFSPSVVVGCELCSSCTHFSVKKKRRSHT